MLKIKDLRVEKMWTQKKLAEEVNTSNKNVWAWENAVSSPDIDMLIKLAQVFDVSVDYLIGNTDDVNALPVAPIHATLPEDERELLSLFRVLSQEDKRGVMRIARSLAGDVKSATVPKAN